MFLILLSSHYIDHEDIYDYLIGLEIKSHLISPIVALSSQKYKKYF